MPEKLSRRSFMKGTAAAAAFGVPAVNVQGSNETLQIGCIGTGGRCRALMQALERIPNVRILALCDLYDANLDLARKLADPAATTTHHFHELLDRKDIEAVVIAAPDHWHRKMTLDALAANYKEVRR